MAATLAKLNTDCSTWPPCSRQSRPPEMSVEGERSPVRPGPTRRGLSPPFPCDAQPLNLCAFCCCLRVHWAQANVYAEEMRAVIQAAMDTFHFHRGMHRASSEQLPIRLIARLHCKPSDVQAELRVHQPHVVQVFAHMGSGGMQLDRPAEARTNGDAGMVGMGRQHPHQVGDMLSGELVSGMVLLHNDGQEDARDRGGSSRNPISSVLLIGCHSRGIARRLLFELPGLHCVYTTEQVHSRVCQVFCHAWYTVMFQGRTTDDAHVYALQQMEATTAIRHLSHKGFEQSGCLRVELLIGRTAAPACLVWPPLASHQQSAAVEGAGGFVRRQREMEELQDGLSSWASTGRVVLAGLSGVGKSELARQYVREPEMRRSADYQLICVFRAGNHQQLVEQYGRFARWETQPLAGVQGRSDEEVVELVKEWLTRQRHWLLLFDGAPSLLAMEPFLPARRTDAERTQHVLVTSSHLQWPKPWTVISVQQMLPAEAVTLLRQAGHLPDNRENDELLESLAWRLGGLPLALRHAGAYIWRHASCDPVKTALANYTKRLLEPLAPLSAADAGSQAVSQTWTISLEGLRGEMQQRQLPEHAAEALLTMCAYLDTGAIPRDLLQRWTRQTFPVEWQQWDTASGDDLLSELLTCLYGYSLLCFTNDSTRHEVQVHGVLAVILRHRHRALWSLAGDTVTPAPAEETARLTTDAASSHPLTQRFLASMRVLVQYHLDCIKADQNGVRVVQQRSLPHLMSLWEHYYAELCGKGCAARDAFLLLTRGWTPGAWLPFGVKQIEAWLVSEGSRQPMRLSAERLRWGQRLLDFHFTVANDGQVEHHDQQPRSLEGMFDMCAAAYSLAAALQSRLAFLCHRTVLFSHGEGSEQPSVREEKDELQRKQRLLETVFETMAAGWQSPDGCGDDDAHARLLFQASSLLHRALISVTVDGRRRRERQMGYIGTLWRRVRSIGGYDADNERTPVTAGLIGERREDLLIQLHDLSLLYKETKQPETARRLMLQVVAARRLQRPAQSPRLLFELQYTALGMAWDAGKWDEIIEEGEQLLLQTSEAGRQELLYKLIFDSHSELAICLRGAAATEHFDEAADALRRLLNASERYQQRDDWYTRLMFVRNRQITLINLVNALLSAGKPLDCIPYLSQLQALSPEEPHPLLWQVLGSVYWAAAGCENQENKREVLLAEAAAYWEQFMAQYPPLPRLKVGCLTWARFTLSRYPNHPQRREQCADVLCELSLGAPIPAPYRRVRYTQLSRPYLTPLLQGLLGERSQLELSTWLVSCHYLHVCLQRINMSRTPLSRLRRRLEVLDEQLQAPAPADEVKDEQQEEDDTSRIKSRGDRDLLQALLSDLRMPR